MVRGHGRSVKAPHCGIRKVFMIVTPMQVKKTEKEEGAPSFEAEFG